MVLSDPHVPFHDKRSVLLALDFMAWFKPARVFLNGDVCDFYTVSAYDRDPARGESLQAEIDETVEFLGDVRRAAGRACQIHYLEGNHEVRMRRWLWQNPDVASLRSLELPNLLGLRQHRIQFHDERADVEVNGFRIEHGHQGRMSQWSGYTAKAMLERRQVSGVSGHVHRLGSSFIRNLRGSFVWLEGGCLCEVEPHYGSAHPNWQQGFTIGWHVKGGRFQMTQVPIAGHKIYFADTLWQVAG